MSMKQTPAESIREALYDLAPGSTVSGRVSTLADLTETRQIIEQAERLQAAQVADLRAQGVPWSAIATALGISTQGAHKRFRD